MLVHMVMHVTTRGDKPGWTPEDLNSGHIDSFYFLVAVLTAIDFVIYLSCAKWYKHINVEGDELGKIEVEGQDQVHGAYKGPVDDGKKIPSIRIVYRPTSILIF
ncbi:hypothetical protein RJ641_031368 [Dillenia turbinata]|uniref:Uncharacterized protein n=1 Tax=Dillenia turbinata TaxID=194707 RepID=A0AAN8ZKW4_9MAGN